jgi:nicotinate-nucleotide pyrophosphorylase (carboxylating)
MEAFLELNLAAVSKIIDNALDEDIGERDITSELVVPEQTIAAMAFVNREEVIACGVEVVPMVFKKLNRDVKYIINVEDGETVPPMTDMIIVEGNARSLLTAERTALNVFQRMCSVATLTRNYVKAVEGTKAIILDTRKTMPGLREIDKYACFTGGAWNHRFKLDDGLLIKDNHIETVASLKEAVRRAKAGVTDGMRVEVECETLEQVYEALEAKADVIMLDNMSPDMVRKAVNLVNDKVPTEASGGINLENVRAYAETGVDFISIGRLTHSVMCVDIGMDFRVGYI